MDLRAWPARGRGAKLAAVTGRTPKAASKWMNAESMPGAGQMAAIATELRVNQAWLEYGEGPCDRGVGVAESPGSYAATSARVPLVEWDKVTEEVVPDNIIGWVISPVPHSPGSRAVSVPGTSMAPRFRAPEVLIVDPSVTATPGRYVIARNQKTHELVLRQLLTDGGRHYLQAENPAWPEKIVPLGDEWRTCATVIGKFEAL